MHTDIAIITEYHFVRLLGVGRSANIADDILIEFDAQAFFQFKYDLNLFPATNLERKSQYIGSAWGLVSLPLAPQ